MVDALSRTVRIYQGDGIEATRVGGVGDGPGEYGSISAIGSESDSLWIFDLRLRRFTIMDSVGKVGRTALAPHPLVDGAAKIVEFYPRQYMGSGQWGGEALLPGGPDRDGPEKMWVEFDESGEVSRALASIPAGRLAIDLGERRLPEPFSVRNVVAAAHAAAVVLSVDQTTDPLSPLAVVHTEAGVDSVPFPPNNAVVPPAHIDSLIEGAASRLDASDAQELRKRAYHPETFPAVDLVLKVGADTTYFTRRFAIGQHELVVWSPLDGVLWTAPLVGYRPGALGSGRLVLLTDDPFDVPSVHVVEVDSVRAEYEAAPDRG
jgi:hypothetical protein